MTIERIMFPTDFSEASKAAIPWVARIAEMTAAQVFIVHVLREDSDAGPDPNYHYRVPEYSRQLQQDARKKLHEVSGYLPRRLAICELLVHGDVIEQLLKAVKGHDIDMIVMATRGETGWRNLLFGSVAEQVIKLAECPVLSIRKPNPFGVVAPSGNPPTAA